MAASVGVERLLCGWREKPELVALCEPGTACQEYIIRISSKKKEHLHKCKCSKTISFGEHNTLKAQHFPMQRYSFFHYYNIYFMVDTYLKKRASAQS